MALRKQISKQYAIPHEPGQWMQIRQLGLLELQASKDVKSQKAMANVRLLGGDIYKAIQEASARPTSDGATDPLAEHDLYTLLCAGIVSWSYEDGKPTPDDIGTLDEQTSLWAARIILGVETGDTEGNAPSSANSTDLSVATGSPLTNG